MLKFVTFNVNGLRSAWAKGLRSVLLDINADVVLLQEIRCSGDELDEFGIAGYDSFFCPSKVPGRGGVGAFSRIPVLSVYEGLGVPSRAGEGRAMTLKFEKFFLVNVYAPAGSTSENPEEEKAAWFDDLRKMVSFLESKKPVVICGDLNIVSPIFGPSFGRNPRFVYEDAAAFHRLLNVGFFDAWYISGALDTYITWVPYGLSEACGQRLDYFLVSNRLFDKMGPLSVLDVKGISDHRPVELVINI